MEGVDFSGWLEKKGTDGLGHAWKKRFFVLKGAFLFYYKSDKDFKSRKEPQGKIDMSSATIEADMMGKVKKSNSFGITTSKKTYPICAESGPVKDNWLRALYAAKGERYNASAASQSVHAVPTPAAVPVTTAYTPATTAPAPAVFGRDEALSAQHNAILVTIQMKNLPKMDSGIGAKSDPYFKLFDPNNKLLYRSEVIDKDLSPKFQPFYLPLSGSAGLEDILTFEVWDWDKDGKNDRIGTVKCTPRNLLSVGRSYPFTSSKETKHADMTVLDCKACVVDPPSLLCNANGLIRMEIIGIGLDKKDSGVGAKSDPFLMMYKGDASDKILMKTEVAPKTLDPVWQPITIDLMKDFQLFEQITISCFDHDSDGGRDLIGRVSIPMREFIFPGYRWPLIGDSTRSGSNAGYIFVKSAVICGPSDPSPIPQPPAFQLKFSARQIPKESLVKKSDPFLVVSSIDTVSIAHRSEVVRDSSSPSWAPFTVPTPMIFDGVDPDRKFLLQVFDWDPDAGYDLIGSAHVTFRELRLPSAYFPLQRLTKDKAQGELVLESVAPADLPPSLQPAFAYRFSMRCQKLDKKDSGPLGSSDPFLLITTRTGKKIYRSEVHTKDLNPTFNPFTITMADIGGDWLTFFTVSVYDSDPDGDSDLIGSYDTNLYQLVAFGPFQYPLYKASVLQKSDFGMGASGGALCIDKIEPVLANQMPPPPMGFMVHCDIRNLKKQDGGAFGKADPWLAVLGKSNEHGAKPYAFAENLGFYGYHMIHKSEVVKKNLNPKFKKFPIMLPQVGGMDQPFHIVVMDYESDGDHNVVGVMSTTLYELSLGPFHYPIMIRGQSKSAGALYVTGLTPINEPQGLENFLNSGPVPPAIRIKIRGEKFAKMDGGPLGSCDPFFRISDKLGRTIYRSEVHKKNLNPDFKEFDLPLYDVPTVDDYITLIFFDHDLDGTHDTIGDLKFSLRDISYSWFEEAVRDGSGKSRGRIILEQVVPITDALAAPVWPSALRVSTSAQKLKRMDGPLSKSDPFFQIRHTPPGFSYPITLYRSEVIKQSLQPVWKPFDLDVAMIGGIDVPFEVTVFDWDANGSHDVIGTVRTTLREWSFGSYQQAIRGPSGDGRGAFSVDNTYHITAVPPLVLAPAYRLGVSAQRLTAMDPGLTGASDPFFEIRATPDNYKKPILLYRSEVVMKNLNPTWKPILINSSLLGGFDKPFDIVVFDADPNGGHDEIGRTSVTIRDLMFGDYQLGLINSESRAEAGAFSVDWIQPVSEAEDLPATPPSLLVELGGAKLDKMDAGIGGKADPFFEVYVRKSVNDPYTMYYRSEVDMKTLNPHWHPFLLNMKDCGGFDAEIEIKVFDFDPDASHDIIGRVVTTPREWLFGSYIHAIRNPEKEWNSSYQSSGGLCVITVTPQMVEKPPIVVYPAYRVTLGGFKLARKDGPLSKSDPFFKLIAQPPGAPKPYVIYRSEVIKQSLDVVWQPFILNTADLNGIHTNFKVEVYDWDIDGGHDLIGVVELPLFQWLFGSYRLPLMEYIGSSGKSQGALALQSLEPVEATMLPMIHPVNQFKCSAIKVKKPGLLETPDPFFEVRVGKGPNRDEVIYRSEWIPKTASPEWEAMTLDLYDLCHGDPDTLFEIRVFDYSRSGEHTFLGSAELCFRDLMFGPWQFPLLHPRISGSQGGFSFDGVTPSAPAILPPEKPLGFEIKAFGVGLQSTHTENALPKVNSYFRIRDHRGATLYRSEIITHDINPSWKPFQINVRDLLRQEDAGTAKMRLEIFDYDPDTGIHGIIGTSDIPLKELFFKFFSAPVYNTAVTQQSRGSINIEYAKPIYDTESIIVAPAYRISAVATNLFNPDALLGDPVSFFEVRTQLPGTTRPITLYRSPLSEKKTKNPKWPEFDISTDLAVGVDAEIEICVFSFNEKGRSLIGRTFASLKDLTFGPISSILTEPGSTSFRGIFTITNIVPLPNSISIAPPAAAYRITASGNALAKKDGTIIKTSSDPFLEIICHPPDAPRQVVYYRTEYIMKESDPKWAPFIINTIDANGLDTLMTAKVWDYDEDGGHDLIGICELTLRELTFGPPFRLSLTRVDKGGDSQGALCIDGVEPLAATAVRVIAPAYEFHVSGSKLAAKDGIGKKSDPFFEIITTPAGFNYPITYYRSEHIKQTLDPTWKPISINVKDVGGLDREFTLRVLDMDEDGNHDLIGECRTTLRDWIMGKYSLRLTSPDSTKSQGAFNIDSSIALPTEKQLVLTSTQNTAFSVRCIGSKVANKDGIIPTDASASDIFFRISALLPDALSPVTVYRSERAPYNKGFPEWKPFPINMRDIRGLNSQITISLFQWQDKGDHIFLGSFDTRFREISHVILSKDPYLHACTLSHGGKSNGGFAFCDVEYLGEQNIQALYSPAYEFVFSGISLEAMDRPKLGSITGSSDPFFTIRARPPGASQIITLYRSEVIEKNLNPCWKPFHLALRDVKSLDTELIITVLDEDEDGSHDTIGSYTSTLREMILGPWRFPLGRNGASGVRGTLSLASVRGVADVATVGTRIAPAYQILTYGKKIVSLDPTSASDPFWIMYGKRQTDTQYRMLYRSEFVPDSSEPKWNLMWFNVDDVGGLDQLINFECWDSDPDGQHDLIGKFSTTLREILLGQFTFALRSETSAKSGGGFVICNATPLENRVTFPRPIPSVYKLKASSFKLLSKSAGFKLDIGAKCNPYFELLRQDKLIYRSEVVRDQQSPIWNTFSLDVKQDLGAEASSELTVIVWNLQDNRPVAEIGRGIIRLTECTESDFVYPLNLNGEKGRGGFSIVLLPAARETVAPATPFALLQAAAFSIQAHGKTLAKMDGTLIKKDSDPFFRIISKTTGVCLYRSEWIGKQSNPNWRPFPLAMADLQGDIDTPFSVEVYDFDEDGAMDLIGRATTNARDLMYGLPYRLSLEQADGKYGGGFEISSITPISPTSNPLLNPPPALEIVTALRKMRRDKLRLGTLPDLFIQLSAKPTGFDREVVLWRSDVVSQTLRGEDSDDADSTMKPFVLNVSDVRGIDSPFTMSVFEFSKMGEHELVGTVNTTLREWSFGPYVHAIWHSSSSNKSRGALCVEKVTGLPQPGQQIKYYPAYEVKPSGFSLQRMDGVLRKSNPFFEVSIKLPGYTEPTLYYRSAVEKETDDPQWQPFWIIVDEVGGLDNPFQITVWDWHPSGLHLEIGSLYMTVRQMGISAPWRFPVMNPSKKSTFAKYKSSGAFCVDMLTPVDVNLAREKALGGRAGSATARAWSFSAKGLQLDRKDGLPLTGKADPYFIIQRRVPNLERPINLFRSEVVKQTLDPEWAKFTISLDMIGGLDNPFTIVVMDADGDGYDDYIGSFTTSLRQMTFGAFTYALRNPKKMGRSDKNSAGGFHIESMTPLLGSEPSIPEGTQAFTLQAACSRLNRQSLLSGCNAYMELRMLPDGHLVYRSEIVHQNAAPQFKPFDLPLMAVGNDLDRQFAISIKYDDGEGVGAAVVSLRDLTLPAPRYPLVNPDTKASLPPKKYGVFEISSCKRKPNYILPTLPVDVARAIRIKLSVPSLVDTAAARFFTVETATRTLGSVASLDFDQAQSTSSELSVPYTIYRSDIIEGAKPNDWPAFELSADVAGGVDALFYISVYSHQPKTGLHELLGRCKTSFRELSFVPMTYVLKHPKKKFPMPRVRGKLAVTSAELLPHPVAMAIPAGVDMRVEVQSKEKLPEMLFELFAHLPNGTRLMHRSEARKSNATVTQFAPFPFWFCFNPELSHAIFEFVAYRFSEHQLKFVGRAAMSAAELFFSGSTSIPLFSAKKESIAGLDVRAIKRHDAIPQLFPASSYVVEGYAEGSLNEVELYGYPASFAKVDGSPVRVWSSNGASKFQAEWTLESVGGLEREFRLVVGANYAALSLRHLQFSLPATFSLGKSRVVITSAKPHSGSVMSYTLGFEAIDVDALDGIGEASDPYLIIRRIDGTIVAQTNVVEQNLCPVWQPLTIDVVSLGSLDQELQFEVWDYDALSTHDFIGSFRLSMRKMLQFKRSNLINPNKTVMEHYMHSGVLVLKTITPHVVPQILGPPFSIAEPQILPL